MEQIPVISAQRVKSVHSLKLKKYRQKYGQFVVEGTKSVLELLQSDLKVVHVTGTNEWFEENKVNRSDIDVSIADSKQLNRMTSFKNHSSVLAVAEIPKPTAPPKEGWVLAADGLRDPGNLGTMIRIADWYGIKHVVCSEDSVDAFNPKTLSSTMGSFTRIQVHYVDLEKFLPEYDGTVYGCFMEGDSIYDVKTNSGVILIGSESHGIRDYVAPLCDKRITIPRKGNAESLNASVAAGIICDRLIKQ